MKHCITVNLEFTDDFKLLMGQEKVFKKYEEGSLEGAQIEVLIQTLENMNCVKSIDRTESDEYCDGEYIKLGLDDYRPVVAQIPKSHTVLKRSVYYVDSGRVKERSNVRIIPLDIVLKNNNLMRKLSLPGTDSLGVDADTGMIYASNGWHWSELNRYNDKVVPLTGIIDENEFNEIKAAYLKDNGIENISKCFSEKNIEQFLLDMNEDSFKRLRGWCNRYADEHFDSAASSN